MKPISLLPFVPLAAAHYGLTYPPWRFDTLSDEADTLGYSQWTHPCAGVPAAPASSANRTDWPVTGGSLLLDLHHNWTYVFVNLGLGANVTNFNISLTPEFLNVTGKGAFCLPQVAVPEGTVREGDLASLQVVTVGHTGNALYNCADIRFASNATVLGNDQCATDDGITFYAVKQQDGQEGSSQLQPGDSSGNGGGDSAAAGLAVSRTLVGLVVGGAAAVAFGMGL